jgi:hypothetical protein
MAKAKNDPAAQQAVRDLILKLTHLCLMKSRGLPADQIEAANMAGELVQMMMQFKQYMDEDAAPYLNLPDNVVALRPTAH